MNNATTFANREVCNLVFCDYETQKPFLNCDFANTTSTELTGESVYAYGGKGHPKRVVFNGERGGTLTIETQMQSVALYSLLTGADVESAGSFIKRKIVTATADGELTITGAQANGSVNVFALDDDCGTDIGKAGVKEGVSYIVYYMEELGSTAKKISVKADTFPKTFTVYGDTYMTAENGEIIAYKLAAYKCAPQSNLSLSFSNTGDPSSVTITCDLMADEEGRMLDLIMLEDDNTVAGA